MRTERTLAIIKPDAVAAGHVGDILSIIEAKQFRLAALRLIYMTLRQAEGFYALHRTKPFFASLTNFMSSGPSMVMMLEREDAISRWREVMGTTNPNEADPGTIRKLYGTSIEKNAAHGSDAHQTAADEIRFFFPGCELLD